MCVATNGSANDRANLPTYERSIADAIDTHDADLLRQRIDELVHHVAR